jgi:hypothetical protein
MSSLREQLDEQRRVARSNFRAWIAWYMRMYPDRIPTRLALAKALGVTSGAITQVLDPKRDRDPSLATLIAARKLTGFGLDVLLGPPPEGNTPPTTGHVRR